MCAELGREETGKRWAHLQMHCGYTCVSPLESDEAGAAESGHV